ncbi:DUF305 domain-containing protein [Actinoplanes utahensis]|uniref:DUF305 domain-containing protein n=1 Tax=Actinoplanes utahensis TaxID=1869 RepID=UPI00068F214E|nr:DUF305 domain-containing protein [Actinoplanes utahensis]GIF27289.1 hypothetical protein Aut01nite_02750 [Actinoplanes utahensis]
MIRRFAALLSVALAGMAVFLLRDTGGPARLPAASAAPVAAPAGTPSGADEHYARMMVTHHEQAVRMSRTLLAKGDVPERIRLIAEFIEHDQQREIDQTDAWLAAWDRPPAGSAAPTTGPDAAAHGMLTAAQLAELDRADPAAAPTIFLRLMIEHHRGAITMSRAVLDLPDGNAYIRGMARHVINEQTAENDAMTAMLGTVPAT